MLRERALGSLELHSPRRGSDLLETLEIFLDCQLDRRTAAERLHVHPNTLDYRLRRAEELTGLRLSRPGGPDAGGAGIEAAHAGELVVVPAGDVARWQTRRYENLNL